MARERSPDRDKAERMWLESGGKMKLKDIAAALGLGESQIRKWKSQDAWASKLKGNVTNESNSNVTNRKGTQGGAPRAGKGPGAPKGNQNAKGNRGGHGGPVGNKKAVRTGEYEAIWMDMLEEDEQELLGSINTDLIRQADESITLLTIRERRMMQRIKALTDGLTEPQRRVLQQLRTKKEAIPLHDEKTGKTSTIVKSKDELVVAEVEETSYRVIEDILRIEEALTRVQNQKIKALDLKNRLMDEEKTVRIEKLKFELQMLRGGEGDDVHDDGFIEALKGKAAEVWADG
ncbi:phage terminase small subunit [Cohnella sp. GCM10012308]|uniref:phage terminase small subunit n=1 Tax=Cohnella sp. GCM10012308 TaxID=3317329 RepID=UPI00360C1599